MNKLSNFFAFVLFVLIVGFVLACLMSYGYLIALITIVFLILLVPLAISYRFIIHCYDKLKNKFVGTKKEQSAYEQDVKSLHSEVIWSEMQKVKAEIEYALTKEIPQKTDNKNLEDVIRRLLIHNKLTIEEIAEDNQVSLEFVKQVQTKLENE